MKKFKPYYFVLNGTENILYFFENEKVSQCRKDVSGFFSSVEMILAPDHIQISDFSTNGQILCQSRNGRGHS